MHGQILERGGFPLLLLSSTFDIDELVMIMTVTLVVMMMSMLMMMMMMIYLSWEEFMSRTCRVLGTGVLAVCSPAQLRNKEGTYMNGAQSKANIKGAT